ncbi:MAG TPA: GTPase, partial [Spirochaetia bacterium]|nr:GTPase [Spirochaetia bacterium]
MEVGIIGLALSGKTTLFNALTGMSAETTSYTGGKRGINIADVEVPDQRIEKLYTCFKPKKKTLVTVRFKDCQIDFTPDGGITPASLAEIRGSEALTLVIRAFEDQSVPHPFNVLDPLRDLKKLLDSLIFSDYEIAEKRMERLEKESKKDTREFQVLQRLSSVLESGKRIGTGTLSDDEMRLFSGFSFLTAKPVIVVANTGESTVGLQPL